MSLLLLLRAGVASNTRALTVEADTATPQPGATVTLTATLEDEDGNALVGKTIYFSVTGANTDDGTDTTDANGEATFQYVATNIGTDTITATWGAATGLDLVYADIVSTEMFYRLDGFSASVVDSWAFGYTPSGLAYDGDDLITSSATTVRRHSSLTSTVSASITPGVGTLVGVAWANTGNLVVATDSTVYVLDGFTTTVVSSFASPYHNITGLGYDGENLLISTENFPTDSRVYRMEGLSSVADTFFTDSVGGINKSIAWDGDNVLIAYGDGVGGTTDRIRRGTGFSSDWIDEVSIPSAHPVGIEWTAALWAETAVSIALRGSGSFGRVSGRVIP